MSEARRNDHGDRRGGQLIAAAAARSAPSLAGAVVALRDPQPDGAGRRPTALFDTAGQPVRHRRRQGGVA